jgi:hypothetical protein
MRHNSSFNPYQEERLDVYSIKALLESDEALRYTPTLPEPYLGIYGSPEVVRSFLASSRSHQLWEEDDTTRHLVDPNRVVFTRHSDYQYNYPADDSGVLTHVDQGFPGKRGDPGEGYLTGWNGRSGQGDMVSFLRHPEQEKYVVTNGNHRTMKSKICKGPSIHAEVTTTRWCASAQATLEALEHFDRTLTELLVEEVIPYSSERIPKHIVLKVRPKKAQARSFYINILDGRYDIHKLETKTLLATSSIKNPRIWGILLKALII